MSEIQNQHYEKYHKAKKIFIRVFLICLGIFLMGYGIIAMFFNFKIGLAIAVVGIGLLFYLLYMAYNP
ncbi:MAG: hypothetical protein US83_C0006G0081 [Candidatus Falkowbacteria bacterium GW2011_GWC2_38_22]|uniref:Uncharacterized protein n=1 Tax=Candidatus Falkowbacteria bacterium GW2011_GWE1_38_31 TaxID=1618638 RepID=A0A0G0JU82_9BACT|nr:MAG: hypothetical protein US73_C0001G0005 [Candidatus Falkowbacteria bacterium GW2011_GWF2_38_1205]KKQ61441.1 MAG: hypothetical protein US83_C0006G0081 [Candidatus Falkowbacteria bacterium GW2011_GWC2_38_22]KKQ63973.1 MAG: hypothetical protein US84_C0002G0005 [Candidatus Falkowbacteria bacterium GW2011_GWF1_38_22]KKQ66678.1 MAG: hypothetical protein US87_C0001G0199 [Candidatus Falkowbacteria bacterium GW2011_GWE2_38_254]KKQ71078.1 MAG: hypothetical protein US91_C0001G0005 [Candidatus Falkowb